ncbi:hypothetical protein VTO42DRAFT_6800 [Malbranchea cinnamomea]
MITLSHAITSLLALTAVAVAAPTEKRGHHFTIQQGDRVRAPLSPAAHYMRAFQKFQKPVPDHVLTAVQGGTGTVPAVPEEWDTEYLTPITVGGQILHVAIDTGSSDMWVFSSQLAPGARAGHSVYTPGINAQRLDRHYWRILYGDGTSASGNVYIDSVTVGGVTSPKQAVGAAQRVSEEFIKDINNDGVMGISFSNASLIKPTGQTSWFDNVKDTLASPLFAVTLKRKAPGSFDFGYIDKKKYTGEITYTAVDSSDGWWVVTSDAYNVGNKRYTTPIRAIVDTGTTLLLVPPTVAKSYYEQVPNARVGQQSGGYEFPCDDTVPDFSVEFHGYKAVVPGDYIKYQPISKGSNICFGGIQAANDPEFSIFGDMLLKSQYVVFDASGSQPRMGWANQT